MTHLAPSLMMLSRAGHSEIGQFSIILEKRGFRKPTPNSEDASDAAARNTDDALNALADPFA